MKKIELGEIDIVGKRVITVRYMKKNELETFGVKTPGIVILFEGGNYMIPIDVAGDVASVVTKYGVISPNDKIKTIKNKTI